MDKTINITLSGLIFNFTEDAYEKLKNYLDRLKKSLDQQEGAEEIQDDIENRIAELCNEIIQAEKREVIYLKDIESILIQLGEPDDFIDPENAETQQTLSEEEKEETEENVNHGKRVYRDPDDSILGGVCSGIAAYFNVDPIILRGIFVLMFFGFGTGLILYIVLWIIIPKAKTSSDKLRMRGESVNLKNIKSNINKKSEEVKANSQKGAKKFGDFITELFQNFMKVLGPVIAIGLIIVGLTGLISILITSFANIGVWIDQDLGAVGSLSELSGFVFESSGDSFMAHIAFFFLTLTPLLAMTTLGFHIILKLKRNNVKFVYIGLVIIWVLGIGAAIYSGITVSQYLRMHNSSSTTKAINSSADTLYLEADYQPYFDSYRYHHMDWPFYTDEENITFFDPDFDIQSTNDSVPFLKIIYSCNGKTAIEAGEKSREIVYQYQIDNNKIVLDGHFYFPKEQMLRNQNVEIILFLPKGKTVYLDNSMRHMIDDISNEQNIYDRDMTNRFWKMKSIGLDCENCTGNERVIH